MVRSRIMENRLGGQSTVRAVAQSVVPRFPNANVNAKSCLSCLPLTSFIKTPQKRSKVDT